MGQKSKNFNGKHFFTPTKSINKEDILLPYIKWLITRKTPTWPKKRITVPTDLPPKNLHTNNLRISNVGHATFLIQINGINILTDPVWSEQLGPVKFISPKRTTNPGIKYDDLPNIDIVFISHNHFDHLDIPTLKKILKNNSPIFVTPLKNEKILQEINIKKNKIISLDWYNKFEYKETTLTLWPSYHWSNRNFLNRNKCLWGGIVIESKNHSVYFAGDTAYGDGDIFYELKKYFDEITVALLPIGAYLPRHILEKVHMGPEDFVKAHEIIKPKCAIPYHYDVFKLSDESYGQALHELKNIITKQEIRNVNAINIGEHIFI